MAAYSIMGCFITSVIDTFILTDQHVPFIQPTQNDLSLAHHSYFGDGSVFQRSVLVLQPTALRPVFAFSVCKGTCLYRPFYK